MAFTDSIIYSYLGGKNGLSTEHYPGFLHVAVITYYFSLGVVVMNLQLCRSDKVPLIKKVIKRQL